ncbi:hypothetical protein BpHYR1_014267 [Brachionus plicatilis]|uniref:Uncharacterized protein n=1 Tax=Brachionus plicatilis TaxID=10195 RepID=A0A3M7SVW5_BRAPC|nr:hypothetical protein BpHYR1_014267 [Brachionus plicatilis]
MNDLYERFLGLKNLNIDLSFIQLNSSTQMDLILCKLDNITIPDTMLDNINLDTWVNNFYNLSKWLNWLLLKKGNQNTAYIQKKIHQLLEIVQNKITSSAILKRFKKTRKIQPANRAKKIRSLKTTVLIVVLSKWFVILNLPYSICWILLHFQLEKESKRVEDFLLYKNFIKKN